MPEDIPLQRYLQWRWAIDGIEWNPQVGFVGPLRRPWAVPGNDDPLACSFERDVDNQITQLESDDGTG